jgi:hypothetical protein
MPEDENLPEVAHTSLPEVVTIYPELKEASGTKSWVEIQPDGGPEAPLQIQQHQNRRRLLLILATALIVAAAVAGTVAGSLKRNHSSKTRLPYAMGPSFRPHWLTLSDTGRSQRTCPRRVQAHRALRPFKRTTIRIQLQYREEKDE